LQIRWKNDRLRLWAWPVVFLWGFGLFIIADVHNCAGNFITFVKVIACVDGQLRLTPFF